MNKLQKQLDALAARSCACRDGSAGCLLLPGDCNYKAGDGVGRCRYFERSVLPADPALAIQYHAEFADPDDDSQQPPIGSIGSCTSCGSAIVKKSNRTKYCGTCRDRERKKKEAARKRIERSRA